MILSINDLLTVGASDNLRFCGLSTFFLSHSLLNDNRKLVSLSRRMCMQEDDSEEQWQTYVEKLMRTTQIPDKFLFTEEQLVQIAMEENISISQGNGFWWKEPC